MIDGVSADFAAVRLLKAARIAQGLTVAWMVIEGAFALLAGVQARSIALTMFGADSLIELFSAGVVLHRLLVRSPDQERGELSPGERQASRLVGLSLYGLFAYVGLSAGVGFLIGIRAAPSPPGMVLMVASVVVMTGLWRWRLRLADRLGSPALRGDAACSAVCLYLALVTLGGLILNRLFGWWWMDSLAALVALFFIRGEAGEAIAAGRSPAATSSAERSSP